VGAAVNSSVQEIGRFWTAIVVGLAGVSGTVALCWGLGKLAKLGEPYLDHPSFDWFQARQVDWWSKLWGVITHIGDGTQTQMVGVAGGVILTIWWFARRRRWWVPALALLVGYSFEKYGQQILKLVVDRGHPPTTLGTWPSGGCARILVVFGLVIFLALRVWQPQGRRPWAAGGALLALLVAVEAYARTYNLEHWLSDVLGGLVYGSLLLATMVSVCLIVDRPSAGRQYSAMGRGAAMTERPADLSSGAR
jgi:hypothetical protein